MASYNDLKWDSSGDGWTVTYKISFPYGTSQHDPTDASFYTDISNYQGPTGASWYQHSWWVDYSSHGPQVWAKIYHNESEQELVLNSMSFVTCPCNSANQSYKAAGGAGAILGPTSGIGVTFQARYYVLGDDGVTWCDEPYVLPDWTSITYNNKQVGNICYPAGYIGQTSLTINPFFSGCRSGGSFANSDNWALYVAAEKYLPLKAEMTFTEGLTIPPDGYLFLIVDIVDWHGGSISSQTLVMLGDDPYFDTDITTKESPYIWRMTDMGDGTRKWQRTRYPFMWSGEEWIKMSESNADQIAQIENRDK